MKIDPLLVRFAVLKDAADALDRLMLSAERTATDDQLCANLFVIQRRPTRGAFPLVFCKPTPGLAKFLRTTRALEGKPNRIKRNENGTAKSVE